MNDQMNKTKKSNTSNEVRAISSFGGNTQGDALAISLNRVQGNTLINKLPSDQYQSVDRMNRYDESDKCPNEYSVIQKRYPNIDR